MAVLTGSGAGTFIVGHIPSLAGFVRTYAVLPLVIASAQVEDGPMFTVQCPRHGSEVMLTERRITGLEPDGDRLTVRWVCWCGFQGSHRTGRSRRHTTVV